jgi:aminoglycoside phosphotransferase family enzyme
MTKKHTLTPIQSPTLLPYPIDVETYISQIYFIGDYVYKVKKPVSYGYLDFTTLEKRKHYCEREVELNQRLCPDTYLGVVPITKSGNFYKFGGDGEIADYAVWMKKLPQDKMMDAMLSKGKVSAGMMVDLAEKVADFHRRAKTNEAIRAFGGTNEIAKNTGENFWQTVRFVGVIISQERYDAISKYATDFIEGNKSLFRKRMKADKIRDCHGDLHSKSICFTDSGIKIFDCVEFNDRFRYGDVASEVAFLAMERMSKLAMMMNYCCCWIFTRFTEPM